MNLNKIYAELVLLPCDAINRENVDFGRELLQSKLVVETQ
jgi:hypothetical protein